MFEHHFPQPSTPVVDSLHLCISRGQSNHFSACRDETLTWPAFCDLMGRFQESTESLDDYLALDRDAQGVLKAQAGWFIGGSVPNGHRKRGNVAFRQIVTLDADECPPGVLQDLVERRRTLCHYEFFVRTTRKHTPGAPRLQIYIPLSRPVRDDEYDPVARFLGQALDPSMDSLDPAGFKFTQFMFMPTVCRGAEKYAWRNQGTLVDPTALLTPWRAAGSRFEHLPHSSARAEAHGNSAKPEDPLLKVGTVGAFCRAFDIEEAMERFIPNVYKPTGDPNRYTYSDGTTTGGAVVYDQGRFIYSHHQSDPCATGHSVNAFDMVRLHLFGSEDDGKPDSEASYKAMRDMVGMELGMMQAVPGDAFDELPPIPNGQTHPVAHWQPPEGPLPPGLVTPGTETAEEEGGNTGTKVDHVALVESARLRFPRKLKWDSGRQRWLYWKAGAWLEYTEAQVSNLIFDMAKRWATAPQNIRTFAVWANCPKHMKGDPFFFTKAEEWDADPLVVGYPGGLFDARRNEHRVMTPEERITKTISEVPDPSCPTPYWNKYLHDVTGGDPETIRFLRAWFGYCMTGDTSERKLLFIHGTGRNGKTILVTALREMMGQYAVGLPSSQFTVQRGYYNDEPLAHSQEKRVAVCSEVEPDAKWRLSLVKELTGGEDVIRAKHLYKSSREFAVTMKLTIVGNHKPAITVIDDAIRDRFLLLHFGRRFEDHEVDAALPDRLRAEMPGIAAWALDGLMDWSQNRLTALIPPSVRAGTDEYFRSEDHGTNWLEECCETGPMFAESLENLWNSWSSWCEMNQLHPGSRKRSFPEMLDRLGFHERVKDTAMFRGHGRAGVRKRQDEGSSGPVTAWQPGV